MKKKLPSKLEIEVDRILASYALSFAPTEKQYGIFMEEARDRILSLINNILDELVVKHSEGCWQSNGNNDWCICRAKELNTKIKQIRQTLE